MATTHYPGEKADSDNSLRVENYYNEVIEETTSTSDSDDDTDLKIEKRVQTLSTKPPGFDVSLESSSAPIGSVAINNSENVHFGNKTYFNGPVTIKQIIQSKPGTENGHVKTEEEIVPESKIENIERLKKKFTIRTWHKAVVAVVFVILSGAICSIVFSMYAKSLQGDNIKPPEYHSPYFTRPRGDDYILVEVIFVGTILKTLIVIIVTLFNINVLILTKLYDDAVIVDNPPQKENRQFARDHGKGPPQIIAPDHLRIVSRSDWLAQPVEKPLDVIQHPVPWVIIAHTATESCDSQSECVLRVRLIQSFHVESRGWYDIGYNFLVGGDGSAYFGRGWDYVGAHTKGYNSRSIGIAFIGTFNSEPPPKEQIDACLKLINLGVELGKIAKDYKLLAHRQLMSTLSPGDKIYESMKSWPHFVSNFTSISELYSS